MAIAAERDVENLIWEYGDKIEATKDLACFFNAFKTTLEIFIQSGGRKLPRTWGVDVLEDDTHAYLELNGIVYNRGITWPDGKYPDLDLVEIKERGIDRTTLALTIALGEFSSRRKAKDIGFKDVMYEFFPYRRYNKAFLGGILGMALLASEKSDKLR